MTELEKKLTSSSDAAAADIELKSLSRMLESNKLGDQLNQVLTDLNENLPNLIDIWLIKY